MLMMIKTRIKIEGIEVTMILWCSSRPNVDSNYMWYTLLIPTFLLSLFPGNPVSVFHIMQISRSPWSVKHKLTGVCVLGWPPSGLVGSHYIFFSFFLLADWETVSVGQAVLQQNSERRELVLVSICIHRGEHWCMLTHVHHNSMRVNVKWGLYPQPISHDTSTYMIHERGFLLVSVVTKLQLLILMLIM